MPLSGQSSEENPLMGTLGAESSIKKPPQARTLPPIPQRMEENSEHSATCLRMLQSATQNPNFQTPDKGRRGNILEAEQDIPLDIQKNTCLAAVWQETEKEPWLLPARGSMSETEAETKPMLSALGVEFHLESPQMLESCCRCCTLRRRLAVTIIIIINIIIIIIIIIIINIIIIIIINIIIIIINIIIIIIIIKR